MTSEDWKPVRDIRLRGDLSVDSLVRMLEDSGGFTGRKVAEGVNIMERMIRNSDCTTFLAFPACLMATGLRGVMVDMVERGYVDVVITTCGTLDHDLARIWKDYYHGDFFMDDAELRRRGVNRLGNVLVPDDSYGIILEEKLLPMFEEVLADRDSITTRELTAEVGNRLDCEESFLYWCAEKEIPVFIPGITDGSFGSQLWIYWQNHRELKIDLFKDEQELSDIIFESSRTGALIVGGGISKHHVIWWNQFRGGLDHAVYLTTAPEYDGSLSGARVREAVSWGKVKETADHVTIEGEATGILPIMVASIMSRLED